MNMRLSLIAFACLMITACTATGPADKSGRTLEAVRIGYAVAKELAPIAKVQAPEKAALIDAAFAVAGDALQRADEAHRAGDNMALAVALTAASSAMEQVDALVVRRAAQ